MGVETKRMSKAIAADGGEEGFGRIKAWPDRVKAFYNDVRTEMKKVTTPSFKEVQATTTIVVITVFLFGLYFFIVDTAIGRAIDWVMRTMTHR